MVTMRVHRDTFPNTDHGYTWVEYLWFELEGETVSPIIPCAGCCERLGNMPGGPILCDVAREEDRYAPEGVTRTVNSEAMWPRFHHVGRVSITPVEEK